MHSYHEATALSKHFMEFFITLTLHSPGECFTVAWSVCLHTRSRYKISVLNCASEQAGRLGSAPLSPFHKNIYKACESLSFAFNTSLLKGHSVMTGLVGGKQDGTTQQGFIILTSGMWKAISTVDSPLGCQRGIEFSVWMSPCEIGAQQWALPQQLRTWKHP